MELPKRYDPSAREGAWRRYWEEEGIYHFSTGDGRPVYSIDTPPPTVSGDLHLGHCYSYSQTDFAARFWRMNGYNVYYPMGFDDNGLPTERLVEKRLGIKPVEVGREKFVEAIVEVSRQLEADYEQVWRRLSLSVDWRYTYKTISPEARKASQYSFIDLCKRGLAYRAAAPTIWCPTCRTAIAQAEVNDLERETTFVTMAFRLQNGEVLPIATTRPELLPACVAVFVNPGDARYRQLAGQTAVTPLFGKEVPILTDPKADPDKGTGIVMCCTFGDTTDVDWWYRHKLPLVSEINPDGTLNETAGPYAGLGVKAARGQIISDMEAQGVVLGRAASPQVVRVHERCDTPVEYIVTSQWFIRILDHREAFLEADRHIAWHPPYMQARYEDWVEHLGWDWCISRQRYYGVPFPVWYCRQCGEMALADEADLPVDPAAQQPRLPCSCGSAEFEPEPDVMDTWATSSVSPQIASGWLERPELYRELFPMSLRPQAHDIVRTWAFYTIVKSLYHFDRVPWSNVAISGHALGPEGGKISKSRGGKSLDPNDIMDRYSADAVRYWSCSTGLGRDTLVSEEKIAAGQRMVTKLWNVARFTHAFLEGYEPAEARPQLLPADRWALSRLQRTIERATAAFTDYDHAAAKEEVEGFFWNVLTDNYLEMAKTRLYELPEGHPDREAARFTLYQALLGVVKLLAPIMPYITEEIFQLHFAGHERAKSVHVSAWPKVMEDLVSPEAEAAGAALVAIAGEVRRYKSENRLAMGAALSRLSISTGDAGLREALEKSGMDLRSVTRAERIEFGKGEGVEVVIEG